MPNETAVPPWVITADSCAVNGVTQNSPPRGDSAAPPARFQSQPRGFTKEGERSQRRSCQRLTNPKSQFLLSIQICCAGIEWFLLVQGKSHSVCVFVPADRAERAAENFVFLAAQSCANANTERMQVRRNTW